ncbi:MAG: SDR family oxidoreductase [Dehalococcoidia bacterium]|nr:SDR family oxidoreductase [Dehalococcoidia bacterium]
MMPVLKEISLSGNVALITGGGSPWGRAIALALADAGATIAVVSTDAEGAAETARQVEATSHRALSAMVDVRDAGSVRTMVGRVLGELGRIDILVNGEEVIFGRSVAETTAEEFRRALEVNVLGTFLCCQAVGPHMMERGRGRVINMATALSVRGVVNATAYCASKGAIENFTQALALEWAEYGITVNALGPGWFADGPVDVERDRAERTLVRMIPQQRRGVPDDLAGLSIYMASEAGAYMTGQTVFLDGAMLGHL